MDRIPTAESVWLHLYRCHTDILCDPKYATKYTDIAFIEYMKRFGPDSPLIDKVQKMSMTSR